MFTLHGAQPMYRDLKPGSTGDDVAQLQQALRELGHGTGGDARGVFGAGTKAALTAHYRAIGYEPLPAVADGGAALKAAREAVRSATWAVEDASSPTGAAGPPEGTGPGGKGGATPDPGASASPAPGAGAGAATGAGAGAALGPGAGRELVRARQALGEARAALAAAEAADGPMLPTAEAVFLSSLPARVSSVGARAGSPCPGRCSRSPAGNSSSRPTSRTTRGSCCVPG